MGLGPRVSLPIRFPRKLAFLSCFAHYHWIDRPRSITWAVTGRCNANCIFCEVPAQLTSQEDVTQERALKLVEEMNTIGVEEVVLVGGEPLARKDIWQILEQCSKFGIRVLLVTNGLAIEKLDPRRLEVLRRCVSEVRISLDSTDAEQHDSIRGVSRAFDRAVAGLATLRRLGGPEVSISTVVMNGNQDQIPKLVELADKSGARAVYFQPVSPITIFSGASALTKKMELLVNTQADFERLERNVDAGLRAAKRLRIFTTLPIFQVFAGPYFQAWAANLPGLYFETIVRKFVCLTTLWSTFVDYDGSVKPCAVLASTGNIKQSSLVTEWAKLSQFRTNAKAGRLPNECQACFCNIGESIVFSTLRSPLRNWRMFETLAASRLR